jgi:hypothetical protein
MDKPPVPGGVERGVVKPPNEEQAGGDHRANGFLPLSGGSPTVHPANGAYGGDRRMGTMPLGGSGGAIHPPNHRFDVGMAKMPQPPSVTEPGKGAVPVNPWDIKGNPERSKPASDNPTPRQPRR